MNEIIGIITIIMAIGTYAPYLAGVIRGSIKPHSFSWVIWVVLTAIAYVAQLEGDAGPGAWMNSAVLVIAVLIFITSLKNGFGYIKKIDVFVFALGLVAIALWVLANNIEASVVLVCIANTIGYIPTLRKIHDAPHEDAMYMYAVNVFRHGLSIVALANYSLITALFPLVLTVNNFIVVVFLIWRRHVVNKNHE